MGLTKAELLSGPQRSKPHKVSKGQDVKLQNLQLVILTSKTINKGLFASILKLTKSVNRRLSFFLFKLYLRLYNVKVQRKITIFFC